MAKRIERVDIESGDVFGGLKKSAKEANEDVELLSETLKAVREEIESIKTKARGLVIKMNPSNLSDIEAQNRAEKEAIRLANERAKLETTQFRLATMKVKEQERLAKQQERQNKAQTAENSAYAQASKRLNELRKSYKDLAIQGRENESASKAMKKEIIELDAELKRVDASVGQYQRNVGNYSSAFSKLSSVLGTLGVGLSVGAGLKSAFDTIKNFDEANADMAKTLGISTEEASKLSMEFTKLGSVTSIQGLQEIATIGGQFGISASEIGGFVSSMDKLNVALGSDFGGVEETAKQLGALRNIFTDIKTDNIDQDLLGIGNALNELSSKGAKVEIVSDFANRISGLAIPLGVTSGEVLGLSATLAKLNVNAERGGTAVGTIFQRMTQDASGFAKVAGVSTDEFTNLLNTDMVGAFKLVAKSFDGMKGDNVLMSKTLESLKLTGSGASEVFLKMASNTELLDSNIKLSTESLKEQDSILQEVEKKSSTVGASVAKLGNAWDAWILEVNDGTGAQNGIISFFDFISRNLPTIISTVGKLSIGFATFKTVTAVANTDFKALISNFTKFKVEADEAGGKISGFGNALKGVGWTVAIGLAIELGLKLWDVASGAAAAREAMARFQQQVEKGNKQSAGNVIAIQEAEKQIIAKLNEQLKDKKINQEEYNKAVKQARINSENELKANIKSANERKSIYKDQLQELKQLEKLSKSSDYETRTNAFLELTTKADKIAKELNISGDKAYGFLDQNATYTQVIAQLNANIGGTNERLKNYHSALKEIDDATKDFTVQTGNGNKTLGETKKIVKELTDEEKRRLQALKDLADFEQEQLDAEKKKQDDKLARQEEYGQLLEEANKTTREYSMTEMEKELQAVEDKYRRMEDLSEEFLYGQEEILEARLNEENAIRAKYAQEEIKAEEEKQKELAEKEKEALEKRRQERRKFVSDVLDEMKELSQAEEQRIDDRIKAEQDLQNNLQAQANAGNISAQQSIEASKEAERKATLEKQKEQRKQQRIEDVKTLLNIINQNIDKGDSVPIATTKGIASLGIIKAVAKGLSGFAKGTEWRLGQEHKAQLSGVDGHIVKVDSSEGIVKGSLMDKAEKAGISSTDELVNLAVMQKMNDQTNGFQPSMTVGYKINTSGIERRLESIEKAIESKTETQFDPYILNGLAKGIVKTERKGNFTRKTLYKG